jgi:hypothetical protein
LHSRIWERNRELNKANGCGGMHSRGEEPRTRSSTSSQCESREGRRGGNTARCSEEMRPRCSLWVASLAGVSTIQRGPSTVHRHKSHYCSSSAPIHLPLHHHPPVVLLLFACKLLCCCYSATPACLPPRLIGCSAHASMLARFPKSPIR